MLIEKKYLPGQIDSRWTEDINNDFYGWLENYDGKLYMTIEEIREYLENRTR